ncbi:MAG: hypothetical protein OXE85_02475, partial [Roseovarius sp.]|nr:hypothetical protein [Roseovarius sp.]
MRATGDYGSETALTSVGTERTNGRAWQSRVQPYMDIHCRCPFSGRNGIWRRPFGNASATRNNACC